MRETPWTPGPWKAREATRPSFASYRGLPATRFDGYGAQVAVPGGSLWWGTRAEDQDPRACDTLNAEARLIAKAPEMAELLTQLMNEVLGDSQVEWSLAIRDLLAEIRGETS